MSPRISEARNGNSWSRPDASAPVRDRIIPMSTKGTWSAFDHRSRLYPCSASAMSLFIRSTART
jgi:hypothetical protein